MVYCPCDKAQNSVHVATIKKKKKSTFPVSSLFRHSDVCRSTIFYIKTDRSRVEDQARGRCLRSLRRPEKRKNQGYKWCCALIKFSSRNGRSRGSKPWTSLRFSQHFESSFFGWPFVRVRKLFVEMPRHYPPLRSPRGIAFSPGGESFPPSPPPLLSPPPTLLLHPAAIRPAFLSRE